MKIDRAIKEMWKEARHNYLDSIYMKETDVKKDSWRNQYFMFDGRKVYMPLELSTPRYFKEFQFYGILNSGGIIC
jgi:hypothetical protein